ncbi:unnamed protein product [Rhizoctonia solani]|uniref:Jacalin-type lectin domain-containing protein n=1 Tax=Rhizoctonia solani TaxID=456999 RepID=A0A8H3B6D1_9AGAM|nr:unnamed protein product [Rhizoctonia solani]
MNNILPPDEIEYSGRPEGKDQILRDSSWLCGFRVDDMDGPQVSARQVASYADGATPFIQDMNSVSTEVITTENQRTANYVHQGWSIGAIATISPWTSSRIDAANRHNAEGAWVTRRTLVTRLKVQVLLQDLAPAPEFVAAIEAALGLPTRFERFQGVYLALSRWGDVVPLGLEIGSSLALTDTETNLTQISATTSYNSFTYLSTIGTANIVRKGGASNAGWDDGAWTTVDVPATEWRPIRIITVAPTVCLLTNDIQARLTELYDDRLLCLQPLIVNPLGWEWETCDDTDNASRTISKVEVHSSGYIIGLSVHYLDGVVSRAGREAANKHTFKLTNGEHIVEVLTCTDGEWLRGMQFITSKGRCSVICGTLDGIPIVSRSKGGILAGFLTASKKHPQWEYLMTSAGGIWRYDLVPKIPKQDDVYSDYYGARNLPGTNFNDRPLIGNSGSMYISNVAIQAGAHIDGIQVSYKPRTTGLGIDH